MSLSLARPFVVSLCGVLLALAYLFLSWSTRPNGVPYTLRESLFVEGLPRNEGAILVLVQLAAATASVLLTFWLGMQLGDKSRLFRNVALRVLMPAIGFAMALIALPPSAELGDAARHLLIAAIGVSLLTLLLWMARDEKVLSFFMAVVGTVGVVGITYFAVIINQNRALPENLDPNGYLNFGYWVMFAAFAGLIAQTLMMPRPANAQTAVARPVVRPAAPAERRERTGERGSRDTSRNLLRSVLRRQEVGIFLVLVAMMTFFGTASDTFFRGTNLANILMFFSWTAIAAFGMTLVIISGGIDLSVGSVMALSGLVTAMMLSRDTSPFAVETVVRNRTVLMVPDVMIPLALVVGFAVGALCGFINGLLITFARLPPFIATLGVMQIARGICYGVSQGWPVQYLSDGFMPIGRERFTLATFEPPFGSFDLPLPTLIMLVVGGLMFVFLTRTVWGYRIFAVGGNETAARLSGISVTRTKIMIYTICGLLAGAGGVLMTANLGVAAPTAAQGYELDVIAATVVGGSSTTGGEGSVFGTLIGAAIMGTLRTGLNLIGVQAYWLPAAQGLIIIAAITFDQWVRRRQGMRISFGQMFAGWFGQQRKE